LVLTGACFRSAHLLCGAQEMSESQILDASRCSDRCSPNA
jgi:hypothetical protein